MWKPKQSHHRPTCLPPMTSSAEPHMESHYKGGHRNDATRDTPSMDMREEHGMVKRIPRPGIADRVLLMVRCRDFRGGKASWFVYSGIGCFFFCSRSAQCSSWARRIRMIAFANGPPARFKRTISSPAQPTAKRNPIRAKANSRNWRSPRESHFASSTSRVPVSCTAPPVRGRTSRPIGSARRLSPDAPQRFLLTLPISPFLREHERGLL